MNPHTPDPVTTRLIHPFLDEDTLEQEVYVPCNSTESPGLTFARSAVLLLVVLHGLVGWTILALLNGS